MELSELLKRISAMQTAAKSRVNRQSGEKMQVYIQGFCDGLDGVAMTIRKAMDAERMRQRLAKLESELAQDPEPDWSQLPDEAEAMAHPAGGTVGLGGSGRPLDAE